MTSAGTAEFVYTYNAPTDETARAEQIKRADLEFIKVADSQLNRMANVAFRLTSKTTGESHILVTDANGYINTSSEWNLHSNNTNGNDAAVNGDTVDDAKLDPEAGIWFGERDALSDDKGALLYDTYILDELRCEANKGYQLLKGIEVVVNRDGVTFNLGTLTNDAVTLDSVLWDSDIEEERETLARAETTLTDRISYDGLEEGEEYRLVSVLMNKETEAIQEVDGEQLVAEKTFTATGKKGNIDIDHTFDATSLAGESVVAFAYVYKGDVLITSHEDINDLDQTMNFKNPQIKTEALDSETETHYALADEEVTVKDTISITDLLRGYTYEVTGKVVDQETGDPILHNGEEVTATKEIEPNRANAELDMEFTFNAEELAGKTVVVTTEITFDGMVIAEHKDLDNKDQSIYFPGIGTEALDSETNDHIAFADKEVTIRDKVSYRNVKPGENIQP